MNSNDHSISVDVEKIEKDVIAIKDCAQKMLRTRIKFFTKGWILAALCGAAVGGFGVRSFMQSPGIEILRRAGVDVRITDGNDDVTITLSNGEMVERSRFQDNNGPKSGTLISYKK